MQVKNSRPCHFVPLLKVVRDYEQYIKYVNHSSVSYNIQHLIYMEIFIFKKNHHAITKLDTHLVRTKHIYVYTYICIYVYMYIYIYIYMYRWLTRKPKRRHSVELETLDEQDKRPYKYVLKRQTERERERERERETYCPDQDFIVDVQMQAVFHLDMQNLF